VGRALIGIVVGGFWSMSAALAGYKWLGRAPGLFAPAQDRGITGAGAHHR
jgi:hypothetical protein